jgi:hypothetical protein
LHADDAALQVLDAVRFARVNGRAGTPGEIARTLGDDDQAGVVATLDRLVGSGHLEREEDDQLACDCDWPAAPLGSYSLTRWGEASLAALGITWTSTGVQPDLEQAVELGVQAFDKHGDVREALIEAVSRAWQAGSSR